MADGDQGAIAQLTESYGGLVWSLVRRFFSNTSEAEDAVQEIFVDLWRSAGRYDPAVAGEATFVSMIARRRLIDRRRRAARAPAQVELVAATSAAVEQGDDQSEVRERATAAAAALTVLRPDQQRVLRLSIYQGLSHEKIAEATGLPLGTVKTHVRRGLIRLRELLADADGEGVPPRLIEADGPAIPPASAA